MSVAIRKTNYRVPSNHVCLIALASGETQANDRRLSGFNTTSSLVRQAGPEAGSLDDCCQDPYTAQWPHAQATKT